MSKKLDREALNANVLTIVEKVMEEFYDEEEISKLSVKEYARILVVTSTAVIDKLVNVYGDTSYDKKFIKSIVQSEVDAIYKEQI